MFAVGYCRLTQACSSDVNYVMRVVHYVIHTLRIFPDYSIGKLSNKGGSLRNPQIRIFPDCFQR